HEDNNHLKVVLKGPKTNTKGIGAKITVWTGGQPMLREQQLTRGYQSSVSEILHFGLGNNAIDSLSVVWPDGNAQKIENPKTNRIITLDYAKAEAEGQSIIEKEERFIFQDRTQAAQIDYTHAENEFDDFERESLLPHKMSEFGPALAVSDVNGDGLDDFFVGGALGHAASLYIQSSDGTFINEKANGTWQKDKDHEDIDAEFFDVDNDGDMDLYVVSGGNEHEIDSPFLQDRLYMNNGKGLFTSTSKALPKMHTSGGVVKAGDYNNDGKIDLFVGGRQVPGAYPFPATSYLLENKGGHFVEVGDEQISGLEQMGMVTDAVWTDYNQDNLMDLVITGEWMPIQIYKNNGDNSFEKVENTALNENVGWWFSIAAADFDNDGDQDFVVGNLGANYKYKATKEEPFTIHAKDFDENGSIDIVLGYHNQGDLFPLRGRECSSNQMPFIKEKFPDYDSFGKANLIDVYGAESLKDALSYEASNFHSAYIENREGDFIFHQLPNEVQFSSINDIEIIDFDKDGIKDVLVAGNLYQSEVETPRNDASIGMLLKGNGDSTFRPLPYTKSGIFLNTDVKKMHQIALAQNKRGILIASNSDLLRLIVN
ncbi:MAG: FG-GAP-like repeat-containing protein, partial [Allomuricauda sp.]